MPTLFTDIGGVLLTNGWDTQARNKAIAFFELDKDDVNRRHDLYFPLLEMGKITLDEYLQAVIFYKKRPFTNPEFMEFVYSQSQTLPEIREVYLNLKKKYGLRIYAVSNESAELATYRYKRFRFDKLFDAYIVSGYIGMRKPDPEFYHLALNLAQVAPEKVVYVDDRPILVEAAQRLGIRSIVHTDAASTWGQLEAIFAAEKQSGTSSTGL